MIDGDDFRPSNKTGAICECPHGMTCLDFCDICDPAGLRDPERRDD